MKNVKNNSMNILYIVCISIVYCHAMENPTVVFPMISEEPEIRMEELIAKKRGELKKRNNEEELQYLYLIDHKNEMKEIAYDDFNKEFDERTYGDEIFDNVITEFEKQNIEILATNFNTSNESGTIFNSFKVYKELRVSYSKKRLLLLQLIQSLDDMIILIDNISKLSETDTNKAPIMNNFGFLLCDIILENSVCQNDKWDQFIEEILSSALFSDNYNSFFCYINSDNQWCSIFSDKSVTKTEQIFLVNKICSLLKKKNFGVFSCFINLLFLQEYFFSSFESQDDALSFLIENENFLDVYKCFWLKSKEENYIITEFDTEIIYAKLISIIEEIDNIVNSGVQVSFAKNIWYFFSLYLQKKLPEENVKSACKIGLYTIFDTLGRFFCEKIEIIHRMLKSKEDTFFWKKNIKEVLNINILYYALLHNFSVLSFVKTIEGPELKLNQCALRNGINLLCECLSVYQSDVSTFFNFVNNLRCIQNFSSDVLCQFSETLREKVLCNENLGKYQFFFENYSWSPEDGYQKNDFESMLLDEDSNFKKEFRDEFQELLQSPQKQFQLYLENKNKQLRAYEGGLNQKQENKQKLIKDKQKYIQNVWLQWKDAELEEREKIWQEIENPTYQKDFLLNTVVSSTVTGAVKLFGDIKYAYNYFQFEDTIIKEIKEYYESNNYQQNCIASEATIEVKINTLEDNEKSENKALAINDFIKETETVSKESLSEKKEEVNKKCAEIEIQLQKLYNKKTKKQEESFSEWRKKQVEMYRLRKSDYDKETKKEKEADEFVKYLNTNVSIIADLLQYLDFFFNKTTYLRDHQYNQFTAALKEIGKTIMKQEEVRNDFIIKAFFDHFKLPNHDQILVIKSFCYKRYEDVKLDLENKLQKSLLVSYKLLSLFLVNKISEKKYASDILNKKIDISYIQDVINLLNQSHNNLSLSIEFVPWYLLFYEVHKDSYEKNDINLVQRLNRLSKDIEYCYKSEETKYETKRNKVIKEFIKKNYSELFEWYFQKEEKTDSELFRTLFTDIISQNICKKNILKLSKIEISSTLDPIVNKEKKEPKQVRFLDVQKGEFEKKVIEEEFVEVPVIKEECLVTDNNNEGDKGEKLKNENIIMQKDRNESDDNSSREKKDEKEILTEDKNNTVEDVLDNSNRRKKCLYTVSKYGWMPIGGMAVLGCLEPVRNHAWVQSANEWIEEKWKYLWDALNRHEKTVSQDVGSSKIKGQSEGFFKQCKDFLLDYKFSLSCAVASLGMAHYYFKNRDTRSLNKSKKETLLNINENKNKKRVYFW